MPLKGALHVHTACSDGLLGVSEAISVYAGLGFDFIALTDHDHLLREGCYQEGLRGLSTPLLVLEGVELTVFEKGYLHVNRIRGDREVLHILNHPADLDLPLDRVLERIAALRERIPIDAIEVTSKGFRTPEFDVPAMAFPRVATDDSHNRLGCGRAWIELDSPLDKDAIIRAIKRGDFWNCYATSPVAR
jgi:predicted metal-dependent phosphoesterase TrpH